MSPTAKERTKGKAQARTRRRGNSERTRTPRTVDYHNLTNPFPPMAVFSDDRIEAMHQAALELLETLGIKVLLADATGVWLCTRRLHRGRFVWPRPGDASSSPSA